MRIPLALTALVLGTVMVLPCRAGELEDGVRHHVRHQFRQALHAFQRSASQGNAEAQRRLGFMYYHGEGVAQDHARAVALFESAARAGDIASASNLGLMYEHGVTVPQDDARAAAWYRTAAELGDAQSQFSLSILYYKGQGVAQDRIEAAKWWTLAMMGGGALAERVRMSVASAQHKLTTEQNTEGERRAHAWVGAHQKSP